MAVQQSEKVCFESASWSDTGVLPSDYVKLLSFDGDVQRFCKWYVAASHRRLRHAMYAGSVSDATHEAYLLFSTVKPHTLNRVRWTTIAANAIRWAIAGGVKARSQIVISESDLENMLSASGFKAIRSELYEDDFGRCERDERRQIVLDAVGTLRHRLRSVIEMRYGLVDGKPLTCTQVGKVFGVTSARILQLERRAITELQENVFKPAIMKMAIYEGVHAEQDQ